mmetsp:Transcript_27821/g.66111  ORF Transcript_27821/g.66111 Transcript_27821/m.66111 type:complete len:227 (-) Transcript_27821:580-1260(-)
MQTPPQRCGRCDRRLTLATATGRSRSGALGPTRCASPCTGRGRRTAALAGRACPCGASGGFLARIGCLCRRLRTTLEVVLITRSMAVSNCSLRPLRAASTSLSMSESSMAAERSCSSESSSPSSLSSPDSVVWNSPGGEVRRASTWGAKSFASRRGCGGGAETLRARGPSSINLAEGSAPTQSELFKAATSPGGFALRGPRGLSRTMFSSACLIVEDMWWILLPIE